METASMLPESAVLSAAPDWPATPLTSTALLHRTTAALRRKTRPRSPAGLAESPDLSRQASQSDQSRTDAMTSPFKNPPAARQCDKGSDADAEPASSTAPHVSDFDLGIGATSDDDCSATVGAVQPQNPTVNRPPIDRQRNESVACGRPIWEWDSDASSDEDDDARNDYRRLLRKRTPADRDRVDTTVAEIRRKRRKAAKDNQNHLKSITLVKFSSIEASRVIPIVIEAEELEEDLNELFGEVKGEEKDKQPPRKLIHATHNPKPVKKKPAATGVACASKDFVKHSERKGWVVCVYCDTEVWPPNINKHKAACKARSA